MFQKPTKIRSKKLTRAAQGNSCTLHTPYCNNNNETVVFCHAPSEMKGVGTKSDDFWGADGCSGCHRFLDEIADKEVAESYWLKGIYRTLKRRFSEGLIRVQ
jgi:hypothetical protein